MLETERLHIRELTSADLQAIYELHCVPEVDKYNTYGIPESKEVMDSEAKTWFQHKYMASRTSYILGIELSAGNEFIGLMALNLGAAKYRSGEVWYKIFPVFWNKGYVTEALKEILRFAFADLQLHRVEAGCATENIPSIRVLEKVGMTREGLKRKALPIRGEWVDCYEYAVLEDDLMQKPI